MPIGPAKILTMSPDGTATSGTLYLRGARSQYAVRVLGATGRTRVLKYDRGLDRGSARRRSSTRAAIRLVGRRHLARDSAARLRRPRRGARLHFHLVVRHQSFGLAVCVLRCAVWTLDSREGIQYRGALQFEGRCELFWETETPIGSDVPLSAMTHADERGIPYPRSDCVHDSFESESAK